ncbi:conserved hypothetical protein [Alkaliphilus metalliredigens QYMF]|uniref:Aromatic acid exporter family member 1 n=1 Tax=Alkaliphilus metalliredigens (strain QYMF) TaxID=293826 RepID=A6TXC1_ALKMQ|nr:aromatic acid exporter family protein [Alkaliphilus metalliredigens]ABR50839.1 conserved hypothetical protein [Alkaliphilus metalliredigens QYMF]
MNIGLRTLKTGLAVTLTLFVYYLLGMDDPFFAAVAAIIVMQPTVSDSWKMGFNRMLGTLIGAMIGLAFVLIAPGNPIVAGVGIIVLIMIMNKLNWKASTSIATIGFIAIFLNTEGGHIAYTLHRLFDTFVGISIGVVVNYFIYPPTYDTIAIDKMRNVCKDLWECNLLTLEILLEERQEDIKYLETRMNEIEGELQESDNLLQLQVKEERIRVYGDFKCNELMITFKLVKEIYQHIQNIHVACKRGLKLHMIEDIAEDVQKIKASLEVVQGIEKEVLNHQKNIDLTLIIEEIRKVKTQLKTNTKINEYPAEEVVRMIVFLYNLEEALSKLNIITAY